MNETEFQDHVQRLLDGELSAAEFSMFEAELRDNPEALEVYREWAELHCGLQRHGNFSHEKSSLPVVPIDRVLEMQRKRVVKLSLLSAAAVLVVSLITFGLFQVKNAPSSGISRFEVTPGSSFVLSHPDGGRVSGGKSLVVGSRLVLSHGIIELALPNDVRGVVEAPAEIKLISERALGMDRGRGYFEVSSVEGQGFTVVTPRERVVDLGTAFGLEVREGRGETELHVFEGRVRVDSLNGNGGELVEAGRAAALREGGMAELAAAPGKFRRGLPDEVQTVFVEDFETGLLQETDYAILIDPQVVRSREGSFFPGIADGGDWSFRTGLPMALPVGNPGFEEDGEERGRRQTIRNWREESDEGIGWGVHRERFGLTPTEGEFMGRVSGGRALRQELEEVIAPGRTYTLRVDVGLVSSNAVLRFFGSDAGPEVPLAEMVVDTESAGWLRKRELRFTSSAGQATGQTLGIALSSGGKGLTAGAVFDNVRVQASQSAGFVGRVDSDLDSEGGGSGLPGTGEVREIGDVPVMLSKTPVGRTGRGELVPSIRAVFDREIELGSGGVVIRNITDWKEERIVVGDPRLSVSGSELTISPRLELQDGARQLGMVSGWQSRGWPGVFNPSSDGGRYSAPEFDDARSPWGVVGAMRGPNMLTFDAPSPGSAVRREIGTIVKDCRYSVSVGVGVRAASTGGSEFLGYTVSLSSGDTILARVSSDEAPGPPNSVTNVELAWDSFGLPKEVAAGDSLVLEISPNQVDDGRPGYLDVDHVRVTALPY